VDPATAGRSPGSALSGRATAKAMVLSAKAESGSDAGALPPKHGRAIHVDPRCPLCWMALKTRFSLPHSWVDKAGRPYEIVWCSPCAYGRIAPFPTQEESTSYYDRPYYTHDLGPSGTEKQPGWDERIRLRIAKGLVRDQGMLSVDEVRSALPQPHPEILDIGCGNGLLLSEFEKRGCRVLGIEPDPAARRAAARRNVPTVPGRAEAIPSRLRHRINDFDAILAIHSLEHAKNFRQALNNAFQLLRPGGLFICEVPNHESLGFADSGTAWFHTDAGRHMHFLTEKSLRSFLEGAGFGIVRTEYAYYLRQFTQRWIESEQEVWDDLHRSEKRSGLRQALARPSSARAWRLLLRSAVGPTPRKYDTVRIWAQKPAFA
jgi:SAM-dependent methyltransferase